jgi:hypothetical protein
MTTVSRENNSVLNYLLQGQLPYSLYNRIYPNKVKGGIQIEEFKNIPYIP